MIDDIESSGRLTMYDDPYQIIVIVPKFVEVGFLYNFGLTHERCICIAGLVRYTHQTIDLVKLSD